MRWLSVLAALADLVVGLVLMIFRVNWDVFKALCGSGHTFDAHYGVEIGTPDEIFEDFCAYSNIEQVTLAASCVQLILDILILLALLQILPELPLQAEARREAIKKLSAGLGALGASAFDSRSGPTSPSKDPQLRDLESLEGGHAWTDDLGVGISLGSGRKRTSRKSAASPREESDDGLDGLLSSRSRESGRRRQKRHSRKSQRDVPSPGSARLSRPRVEDMDWEDIELGQLFAPVRPQSSRKRRASVRAPIGPVGGSLGSPRKAESPRKIGRAEEDFKVKDTAPSLSSWGTVEEGPTANLFLSMRSSAAGLPQEDEVDAIRKKIEEDDQDFGTDFFAYALWVSETFDSLSRRSDPHGDLLEASLSELFHEPIQPAGMTRL